MYADDCALVAESPTDLQRMLDALQIYCQCTKDSDCSI